jgi:hypothetical protein
MKKISTCIVILATSMLASCGGGGSIGDGTQKLTTSPTKLEVSSSTCGYGSGAIVTVYGGVAPYYLKNSLPQSIGLNKEKVSSAGDNFKVDLLGGCFTTMPILILDSNGNTFEFLVTHSYVPLL